MKKLSSMGLVILFSSLMYSAIAIPVHGIELQKAPATLSPAPTTTRSPVPIGGAVPAPPPIPAPTTTRDPVPIGGVAPLPTSTYIKTALDLPTINTDVFNNAVRKALSGAIFQANSCFNPFYNGVASLEIPGTDIWKPALIANFHYILNSDEIRATTFSPLLSTEPSTQMREVYSCIWYWTDKGPWNGRIQNGAFFITIPIGLNRRAYSNPTPHEGGRKDVAYIANYGKIAKINKDGAWEVINLWDESIVEDIVFEGYYIEIALTPTVNNTTGMITYGNFSVIAGAASPTTNFINYGVFIKNQIPKSVKDKILTWKRSQEENIKDLFSQFFADQSVRDLISSALTIEVKKNPKIKRITGISVYGTGSEFLIAYE